MTFQLRALVARWREPTPAAGRGEAVLYGFVHPSDIHDMAAAVAPPLPHVDRVLHDLVLAGWGTPARSLAAGLVSAGYGPVGRARKLVVERVRDGRLVMGRGGKWTWWSDR